MICEKYWFYISIILFVVVAVLLVLIVLQKRRSTKSSRARIQQVETKLELLNNFKNRLNNLNQNLGGLEVKPDTTKKTQSKFFSMIAHDLRGPTASLISFAELLIEGFQTMSDRKKLLLINSIFSSSNQLLDLLDNLLNWATSQTEEIEAKIEKIDLAEIQENTVSLLYMSSEKKRVLINAKIPKDTCVMSDKKMTLTVFRNILNNAIKFSEFLDEVDIEIVPEHETIHQKVDRSNFHIVRIKDSGIGLPEELQQNLFTSPVDAQRTGTSGEKGTGLGLMVCKDFIEKCGGIIWGENNDNKGSSFFFTLPKA